MPPQAQPPSTRSTRTSSSVTRRRLGVASVLVLIALMLAWGTVGTAPGTGNGGSAGADLDPTRTLEKHSGDAPLPPIDIDGPAPSYLPPALKSKGYNTQPHSPSTSPSSLSLPSKPSLESELPISPPSSNATVFPDFGFDKSITEIVVEDPARDGTLFNVRTSRWCEENPGKCDGDSGRPLPPARVEGGEGVDDWEGSEIARAAIEGKPFITKNEWKGKCWYETEMFCVLNGTLTFFHDHKSNPSPAGHSLRMCNEFSQHSQLIRLKYQSLPMPAILPAPLYTKTPGWVLQYWCQDLFHMTLSMLPAFHTKQFFKNALTATMAPTIINNLTISAGVGGSDDSTSIVGIGGELMPLVKGRHVAPDIHIRIAKGKRKKSAFCRIKLGDPRSWEDVRNKKWSDAQFPIAGNPYWPFYQLLTDRPDRLFPMYKGATGKSTCYTSGIIDKKYIKESNGLQARQYSSELLKALHVPTGGSKRQCGKYRVTLIDRRGRTRKLTNIPEIAALGREKGFTVTPVALELLPIRKQLELITNTDVLMGMHGNGITWLQFLPPGSAVLELVGVWYTPYSLLWGHKHFHSSMKNNMDFKKGGEYKPFAHNMTEIGELLDRVKEHLDSTSCEKEPFTPPNERLDNLYKSCVPHC